MKWSSFGIEEETKCNQPGVYRIRLFNGNTPVTIRRLQGADAEGMLAIGQSKNIERRRKDFLGSLKGKRRHSEGMQWRLVKLFSNKLDNLRFDFVKTNSKKAKKMEDTELREYFKKHLELPPLNGVMPNRKKWIHELFKNHAFT